MSLDKEAKKGCCQHQALKRVLGGPLREWAATSELTPPKMERSRVRRPGAKGPHLPGASGVPFPQPIRSHMGVTVASILSAPPEITGRGVGGGGSQETPRLAENELGLGGRGLEMGEGRGGTEGGSWERKVGEWWGGRGEARRRQLAVVLSPWVPFNSVNVPGWRQEGSSIIKLIEMRLGEKLKGHLQRQKD